MRAYWRSTIGVGVGEGARVLTGGISHNLISVVVQARRLSGLVKDHGVVWASLFIVRSSARRIVQWVEPRMISWEKRHQIAGDKTLTSQSHTVDQNRALWNNYDWSGGGEEWTQDARVFRGIDPEAWRTSLIANLIDKYLGSRGAILEIGPGAGRWSQVLLDRCDRLILADISERCLELCRARFAGSSKLEFHLIRNGTIEFVPDRSLDGVWAYDVFVHINPTETDRYLSDLARAMKPGAIGILHHAGTYESEHTHGEGGNFRSHADAAFYRYALARHGLILIEQDETAAHLEGDVISVFRRQAGA